VENFLCGKWEGDFFAADIAMNDRIAVLTMERKPNGVVIL
jgi:hypothetical protein